MQKAIVTIASGDYYQQMAALTHPTLAAYADRVGAQFIVWTDSSGYEIPEYKKLEVGGLLDEYERILAIDTDVIIRDDAPDVFELVPTDHIGMFEESQLFDRREAMSLLMEELGRDIAAWQGKYYNTGVIVCSQCHRDLFVRPPVASRNFGEQSWVNLVISDRGTQVFPLPYRFNRFVGWDFLYGGENRLDAWFVHYAGAQSKMSRHQVLELIAHDLASWRKTAPRYRYPRKIAIDVAGALAEQVAAEPVVRYARDVAYRDDKLVVVSPQPNVFRHLELPVFHDYEHVPYWYEYLRLTNRSEPIVEDQASEARSHPTLVASRAALGLELPLDRRRPKLDVEPAAVAAIARLVAPHDLDSLVLLHPGKGTPDGSVPRDLWQAYADTLAGNGFSVAVIGKRREQELGIVEFNRSKCLDLTDKITMSELVALVSRARVLLANDSAPVQIAGAFDGWIGLIHGASPPESVLPWREGSPWYRAANLFQKEPYEKLGGAHSAGLPGAGVHGRQSWRDRLPDPSAVLSFVRRAFNLT